MVLRRSIGMSKVPAVKPGQIAANDRRAKSASFYRSGILECCTCEFLAVLMAAVPVQAMTEEPTVIVVDDDPGIQEASAACFGL
jgi:anti-sigma-K factor RskA